METPSQNLLSATQNEGGKKTRVSELRASLNIEKALTELESKNFKSSLEESSLLRLAQEFNLSTLPVAIACCDIVLEEKPLTVRRVLYRCASAGIVAGTDDRCYNQVQRLVLQLRRKEFLDYRWISDSTRSRDKSSSWSGLEDFSESARNAYRKDLWSRQTWHIEVFTEKDAMSGVLRPITREYDIHLNVIRGQVSESFAWNIADEWSRIDKPIQVLYFGDHDPSGFNIEASLKNRLLGFLPKEKREWVFFKRLGANDADFRNSDLISIPVKKKDKSAREYLKTYGDRCVEVDAIDMNEIRRRLEEEIESFIDMREWESLQLTERLEKETIDQLFSAENMRMAS
jgi:hypothetical protein